MRCEGTELPLRRRRDLRRRPSAGGDAATRAGCWPRRPPGRRADADLRTGRLGGRRRTAAGGQGGCRWSAHPPAWRPTTSGGRTPGSSRPCSRPGRRPVTWRWAAIPGITARGVVRGRPGVVRRRRAGHASAGRGQHPGRHRDRELKLGAGGLRDVEFAVQLLQLVHGRTDPDLRCPGTLMALRSLIRGGYVGRSDGAEMAAAYTFLRRTEHRLQLQRLRRTHSLPEDRLRPRVVGQVRRVHGGRRSPPPRCSSPSASGTPPPSADCTRSCSTGRCCMRSPPCRTKNSGSARRRPPPGWPLSDSQPRVRAASSGRADRRGEPAGRDPANPAAGAARHVLRQSGPRRRPAVLPAGVRGARRHALVSAVPTRRGIGRAAAGHPARWVEAGRQPADQGAGGAPVAGRRRRPARPATGHRPRRPAGPITRAASAQESVDAARSARRQEMLRLACGDLLGLITVTDIACGLTSVAEASLPAAYEVRCVRLPPPAGERSGPAGRHRDGPTRRRRARLLLRRRCDVRRRAVARRGQPRRDGRHARRGRPDGPAAGSADPGPAVAGRRQPSAGGQERPAGPHPGGLPVVLAAVRRAVGATGAAAGPADRRRRGTGPRVRAAADEFRYPVGGLDPRT